RREHGPHVGGDGPRRGAIEPEDGWTCHAARDDGPLVLRLRPSIAGILEAKRPCDRPAHPRARHRTHLLVRAPDEGIAVLRFDGLSQYGASIARRLLHALRRVALTDDSADFGAVGKLQPGEI